MNIQNLVREKIIGNIKIGTKGEKGLPKKLGYFNVEEDKATSSEMVDIFKQLYPNKPTNLKIKFTSEDPFNFRFKRYVNNKVVCMGNDVKAITVGKDDKNKTTQIEVECSKECEHRLSGKCKLVGSLKFVLDGINAGGVWKINTSGGISLSNIASEIYKYKKAGMSIVGVPFELKLNEQQSLGYGIYYSIDLHRTDIKPELVENIKPQLGEAKENNKIQENKSLPEGTNKKNDKEETSKVKIEDKQVVQEVSKVEEISKTKEHDISKQFAVKGFMPTLIKNKKFDKIILQDTNSQDVEYILHPKANQEIIKCGVGTLIEIKEARMEMDRNILCKYDILQVVAPDGNMEDYNTEELKEAV